MKSSLGISNFLEEISSLVFPILLFSSLSLNWSLRKAFLSLLAILWNSVFKWVYLPYISISCHSLLACRVSVEKSAGILMGVPLYVICPFPLFHILSLSLIFVILITMCLSVFFLGFILPGTLCASWTWLTISFPMLGKFSAIILQIFYQVLSLSFSFWDPYIANGVFNVVPEVS